MAGQSRYICSAGPLRDGSIHYYMLPTPPIRIAYAEDHDVVRSGICALLEATGMFCVTAQATNGKELLEQLDNSEELPHICILDVFMPVMNGLETLLALRAGYPQIRTLVLTGHNTEYFLIRMMRAGASGYLLKNSGPTELLRALKEIHDHGSYNSGQLSDSVYQDLRRKDLKLPELTAYETRLLQYCCSDLSYGQIAEQMNTTVYNIEYYRTALFKKLRVKNRSGLVLFAIQSGIMPLDIGSAGQEAANDG